MSSDDLHIIDDESDPGRSQASTIIGEAERSLGEIGPYTLLKEVGRGAVGIVFKAYHAGLRQYYAVKVLRPELTTHEREVKRFLREAQAMARLGKHPHIVQVHAVGTEDGRHYFAMDYVEGDALDKLIDRRGLLGEREALRIVKKVCFALEHAHRQQLVHRDVKPSNVILDVAREPQVSDFGLAKDISVTETATRAGTIVGTPAYMAPEQAAGHVSRVDARSDVFSVGALLYHLVTGRRPFEGDTPIAVINAVLHEEPIAPRRRVPAISPATERVILRALEKNPARRFETAEAMAADIARAIKATPATPPKGLPVVPAGAPQPVDPAAETAVRRRRSPEEPIRAVRTNDAALAAWKWGVFGFGVLSFVGVVAGLVALIQLRFGSERDRERGYGLALGGMSIGAALTAAAAALAFFIYGAVGASDREKRGADQARQTRALLGQLDGAIERYARKAGSYPRAKTSAALRRALAEGGFFRGASSFPVDRAENLIDPYGRPLRYRGPGEVNRDSYDLWSVGPDGADDQGGGDDTANFDPRYPDLLPAAERPDSKKARALLDEVVARPAEDLESGLRDILSLYPGTPAAADAEEKLRRIDVERSGRPHPASVYMALDSTIQQLEIEGRLGAAVEACDAYLKGSVPPEYAADITARRERLRGTIDEEWFQARLHAAAIVAKARREALASGAPEAAIEPELDEAKKALDAVAMKYPGLLGADAKVRAAALAADGAEIRRLRALVELRQALRAELPPFLIRRDHDGAEKALAAVAARFPADVKPEIDATAEDIARIRKVVAAAAKGTADGPLPAMRVAALARDAGEPPAAIALFLWADGYQAEAKAALEKCALADPLAKRVREKLE